MGLLDAEPVYRAYRAWRMAASWHVLFCDGVLLLADSATSVDTSTGAETDRMKTKLIKLLSSPYGAFKRPARSNRARQFNRMMGLRDKDVHQGKSEGKTLANAIPIERNFEDDFWMYQQQSNYAALGIGRPVTEHINPDGSTVSSYDGLQGSMSLYIEIAGETCEASNACEKFIAQLSQLIDAVGAANLPPLGPLQRLWLWFRTKLRIRD
jgi:hypothetical protein